MFAFIAAAAGTGNDDHQMEVVVQENGEPATKKQRSHPESLHTEQECLQERVGTSERHLQNTHSAANETVVRALRRKGAKLLNLRLARDFVCPQGQEIQSHRPHPVASLEAIPFQAAEHTSRSSRVEPSHREPSTQNFCHHRWRLPFEGCQDAFSHE